MIERKLIFLTFDDERTDVSSKDLEDAKYIEKIVSVQDAYIAEIYKVLNNGIIVNAVMSYLITEEQESFLRNIELKIKVGGTYFTFGYGYQFEIFNSLIECLYQIEKIEFAHEKLSKIISKLGTPFDYDEAKEML